MHSVVKSALDLFPNFPDAAMHAKSESESDEGDDADSYTPEQLRALTRPVQKRKEHYLDESLDDGYSSLSESDDNENLSHGEFWNGWRTYRKAKTEADVKAQMMSKGIIMPEGLTRDRRRVVKLSAGDDNGMFSEAEKKGQDSQRSRNAKRSSSDTQKSNASHGSVSSDTKSKSSKDDSKVSNVDDKSNALRIMSPLGVVHEVTNLRRFCFDEDLSYHAMGALARGTRSTAKSCPGWEVRRPGEPAFTAKDIALVKQRAAIELAANPNAHKKSARPSKGGKTGKSKRKPERVSTRNKASVALPNGSTSNVKIEAGVAGKKLDAVDSSMLGDLLTQASNGKKNTTTYKTVNATDKLTRYEDRKKAKSPKKNQTKTQLEHTVTKKAKVETMQYMLPTDAKPPNALKPAPLGPSGHSIISGVSVSKFSSQYYAENGVVWSGLIQFGQAQDMTTVLPVIARQLSGAPYIRALPIPVYQPMRAQKVMGYVAPAEVEAYTRELIAYINAQQHEKNAHKKAVVVVSFEQADNVPQTTQMYNRFAYQLNHHLNRDEKIGESAAVINYEKSHGLLIYILPAQPQAGCNLKFLQDMFGMKEAPKTLWGLCFFTP